MKYEDGDFGCRAGGWFLSFIVGGVVGAAVALLLAPKSGKETREQIKGMAQDAKEKAEDYYDQVKTKVTDVVHKGVDAIHHKTAGTDAGSNPNKG